METKQTAFILGFEKICAEMDQLKRRILSQQQQERARLGLYREGLEVDFESCSQNRPRSSKFGPKIA